MKSHPLLVLLLLATAMLGSLPGHAGSVYSGMVRAKATFQWKGLEGIVYTGDVYWTAYYETPDQATKAIYDAETELVKEHHYDIIDGTTAIKYEYRKGSDNPKL